MKEAIVNDLARMLHNEVNAMPRKPEHTMNIVEYGQLRRGELARELLFWLAGRTGDIEKFIMFPTEGMK